MIINEIDLEISAVFFLLFLFVAALGCHKPSSARLKDSFGFTGVESKAHGNSIEPLRCEEIINFTLKGVLFLFFFFLYISFIYFSFFADSTHAEVGCEVKKPVDNFRIKIAQFCISKLFL